MEEVKLAFTKAKADKLENGDKSPIEAGDLNSGFSTNGIDATATAGTGEDITVTFTSGNIYTVNGGTGEVTLTGSGSGGSGGGGQQSGGEPFGDGLSTTETNGLPNGVKALSENEITNPNIKNNNKIKAVLTGEVPIPNGFYYVGGNENDGVVISDSSSDSGKGTSHEVAQTLVGNQFVWVPVETASEFIRYEGYYNGSLQSYLSSCSEPQIIVAQRQLVGKAQNIMQ